MTVDSSNPHAATATSCPRYCVASSPWSVNGMYMFVAVSSIYGVDIMADNVAECRERLYGIAEDEYEHRFKDECRAEVLDSIRYLLSKNIQCGDALTLTAADGDPIVFPEWSLAMGSKVRRRDFTFAALLNVSAEEPTFDILDEIDQGIPVDEFSGGSQI